MDLYGKKPKTEEGRHFVANIWEWSPLLDIITQTKVLHKNITDTMIFGNGGGPDTTDACDSVANKIEELMKEDIRDEIVSRPEILKDRNGNIGLAIYGPGSSHAYSITRHRVKDFVKFLRGCGGFETW